LTNCKNQGIDTNVITNGYDLEIDRQCTIYQKNLQNSNDQMKRMVTNATAFLQTARLAVARKKNNFATMGDCINALDQCMQNDFVCGSDYVNCLDPTGRYIVNGKVVVGSQPGIPGGAGDISTGLYATWLYGSAPGASGKNNPWGTCDKGQPGGACSTGSVVNGDIAGFIKNNAGFASTFPTAAPTDLAGFMVYKIGNHTTDNDTGFCMSVLNQCQNYTRPGGTWKVSNEVTVNFLNRILVSIKSKQDTILANHASGCISDVNQCLAKQNVSIGTSGVSVTTAALSACNSIILTCTSVNGSNATACTNGQTMQTIIGQAMCTGEQQYDCANKKCIDKCTSGKSLNATGSCV